MASQSLHSLPLVSETAMPPKSSLYKDYLILILAFIISRILVSWSGVGLRYDVLYHYWQYLDVKTLQDNLLTGIWYDHTQPPFFNFLLGTVLKLAGASSPIVFSIMLKMITLANTFLLYVILQRNSSYKYLPVLCALWYLLSPATILLENELFYTTLVTLFLLCCCYFLSGLREKITWKNAIGFFLSLTLLCVTRSLYHLYFLVMICILVLYFFRKKTGWPKLVAGAIAAVVITGSWYLKNYLVFGLFTASTWSGMNFARNAFHMESGIDSTSIGSIEPFSEITAYTDFIPPGYTDKYKGLNDRDLLSIHKNDSFLNEKNAGYIEVSRLYMEASKKQVKGHPLGYMKNVVQSAITYFAPATMYVNVKQEAKKIKYYDLVYSFNTSWFAKNDQQRRISMVISAFPKFMMYVLVLLFLLSDIKRNRKISMLNLFIIVTILYVFTISSFVEHFENMRFRYESEPLFLILFAYAVTGFIMKRKRVSRNTPLQTGE